MGDKQKALDLASLRVEIDRIDATMHGLLIERSEVIDQLVVVKGSQETGSAFRPGREAQMMRALAERHRGSLPLDTAEGIWRIIIGTFTFLQAPYHVHADLTGGDGPIRDSARFHFGFTVPCVPQPDAKAVISAVSASRGDLGLIRIYQGSAEPWWLGLVGPDCPKIIARLPMIERPGHPAGAPVFVVSKPVDDAAAKDFLIVSLKLDHWHPALASALVEIGGELVASADYQGSICALVSVLGDAGLIKLQNILQQMTGLQCHYDSVGAHAARFKMLKV